MKDEMEHVNKFRSGFEVDYLLADAQRCLLQKGRPKQSMQQPAGIYHCVLENHWSYFAVGEKMWQDMYKFKNV